jgi:hypothetical protein
MVRSWERDGCWGDKLDLVWIFHGMYRRFSVIPQEFLLLLPFLFFGDFQSFFLGIFMGRIWSCFFVGFFWESQMRFMCLFSWWSCPSNLVESSPFWWFLVELEFLWLSSAVIRFPAFLLVRGSNFWAYHPLGTLLLSPKSCLNPCTGLGDPWIGKLSWLRGWVFWATRVTL